MAREHRGGKRLLATMMMATVIGVVGYGTAVAANVVNLPMGDVENPNASPSPLASYRLDVDVTGSGSGLVTSDPEGIRCGSKCSATFVAGTRVTLHASGGPMSEGRFAAPCSGAEHTCSFVMNADKTVEVTFEEESAPVTVSVQGHGSVATSGGGLHCPGHCSHRFRHGSAVRLFAHPAHGWRLQSWSGACSGRHACVVRVSGARHAVAHFGHKHHHR